MFISHYNLIFIQISSKKGVSSLQSLPVKYYQLPAILIGCCFSWPNNSLIIFFSILKKTSRPIPIAQ